MGEDEGVRRRVEWLKCSRSVEYWLEEYVYIFDATPGESGGGGDWVRFILWPMQVSALKQIQANQLTVVLKARQLGLTWLSLCFALWTMLFRPAATILLFSKRDDEAIELLHRMRRVYERLPGWMQARAVASSSQHDWALSNGSSAKSFPTSGGRSYTGSMAIVDEADFIQDLDELLNAVKPTIDAGGRLALVSSVDKSRPNSPFKRIYRGAVAGETDWQGVFLPWFARPSRDETWYRTQTADILARTGSLDDLHQEYPATDTEALSPRSQNKRIPAPWIETCYKPMKPKAVEGAPTVIGLEIFVPPERGRRYVIGADPAEGNPTSDDSALTVMDLLTGEECAVLAKKLEPSTFAAAVDQVGRWYNLADVMVERNNHGHAVLLWLRDNSRLRVLRGTDGKVGWLNNSFGKTVLYNAGAEMFRDETTILHSFDSYYQLAAIEGSTLLAPEGDRDDRADSYVLANVGRWRMATMDEARPQPGSVSLRTY